MTAKVVVLTGATGAIGHATAMALSAPGTHLLLLARPSPRLTDAVEEARTRGATASDVPVDLSTMASVREAADRINESVDHIDAVVHTAAIFAGELRLTSDGFESMFATNHLAPFLLTNLLRPRLGSGARVVTVTAPSNTPVDADRLATGIDFKALPAFGASKAANLLFTFQLARRAAGAGVRANAMHPGLVRSGLMREAAAPIRIPIRLISRPPQGAAEALARLATAPEFAEATGQFFKGGKAGNPPGNSTDQDAQHRLWERSIELASLGDGGF